MEEINEKIEKPLNMEEQVEEQPKDQTVLDNFVEEEIPQVVTKNKNTSTEEGVTKKIDNGPAMENMDDYELGDLSNEEVLEVKLKPEDSKVVNDNTADKATISTNVYEIESIDIGKEKIKKFIASKEPMQPFNKERPESVGYQTKLKIRYKDTSYVSLIPNIRWYPTVDAEGKKSLNPWFNTRIKAEQLKDPMVSTISKLYFRLCVAEGVEVGKMTQMKFLNKLVGKKVILEQWSTNYKNKDSYRLDVYQFI